MPRPLRPLNGTLRRLAACAAAALACAGVLAAGVAASRAPASLDRGIVDVDIRFPGGVGAGTGLVLSGSGEVLTNNHVIREATSIRVVEPASGRSYRATVVGYDLAADVAVLKLEGAAGLPTVRLGDSRRLRLGAAVTAVGNAGGVGGRPAVSRGTILYLHQKVEVGDPGGLPPERLADMAVSDERLEPGDSGGALLDGAGRVIGMNTAGSGGSLPSSERGFAIPIDDALAIAAEIEASHSSPAVHVGPTSLLGIEILTDSQPKHGVRVWAVLPGSPAQRAGLGKGDVITLLDGHHISSFTEITSTLVALAPGTRIGVGWKNRAGAARSAQIRLASGPAQ